MTWILCRRYLKIIFTFLFKTNTLLCIQPWLLRGGVLCIYPCAITPQEAASISTDVITAPFPRKEWLSRSFYSCLFTQKGYIFHDPPALRKEDVAGCNRIAVCLLCTQATLIPCSGASSGLRWLRREEALWQLQILWLLCLPVGQRCAVTQRDMK